MSFWHRRKKDDTVWLIRQRPQARSRPAQLLLLAICLTALAPGLGLPWAQAAEPFVAPETPTTAAQPVNTRSMEEPLRLIRDARRAFAAVRDYTCTFIKQERIDGQLTPENVIQLKARTAPYCVELTWQQPRSQAGQVACYVDGKNNGKLRARGAGALGLVGFVSLDPNSPRAKGASKYSITEAGIGYLIERFAAGWELEQRLGVTDVRIDVGEFAGRPGLRVEATHPVRADGLLFYRSVVWFDQRTSLPMRVENYDWPASAGGPSELAEQFSFLDVALNVGLPDATFQR